MGTFRIGCQTYTWEMLGANWRGDLKDIIQEVSEAGYEGIEISSNILGENVGSPLEVKSQLRTHGLDLTAIAHSSPSGFTDPDRMGEDLEGAKRILEFLKNFPGSMLCLAGASSPSKDRQREKLKQACEFYRQCGLLAKSYGIPVSVHPHSHHGSLLETQEEYDFLLEHLGPDVDLGPDTGHIVRGGQDLVDAVSRYASRIVHIHFKDVRNREWAPLGDGECDFESVVHVLSANGYKGWIIAEEEASWIVGRKEREVQLPQNRIYMELITNRKEGEPV